MTVTQLVPPYPIFTDRDGSPLEAGYLYFGEPNLNPETNPIQVCYDPGLTQPLAQPIRTSNGYVMRNGSPALIYADSQFSVTVRNKKNELVIYSPVGFGITPSVPFATFENAARDVSALLAGTQFTYLPGIPNTIQVVPGYILRTLAEGFAYAVAASTATDQHVTTAGGVKLYVQPDNIGYNVVAFGAKGDGVTDDTSAIQTAMTNCAVVIIPDGVFIAKNVTVPAGRNISGSGTLKLPPCPSLDFSPILNAVSGGLSVRGISFNGNRSNQPADGFSDSFNTGAAGRGRSNRCAILMNTLTSGLTVENCSFTEFWCASIATQDVSDISVSGCNFYNSNFEGIYAYSSDSVYQDSLSVTLCRFENLQSGDIIVNANCIVARYYNKLIATDCIANTFERNFVKMELCNDANISNNDISNNLLIDFNCLQAQSGGNNISFSNNNIHNVKRGILLSFGTYTHVVISGNRFSGINTTGFTPDAITAEGCDDLIICNNIFSEIDRYYIYVTGNSKSVSITDNVGINTANENFAAIFISCDPGIVMQSVSVAGNVLSGKQSSNDGVIGILGSGTIGALSISHNLLRGAGSVNNRGIWANAPLITTGIVSHNVGSSDCNVEFYAAAGSSVEVIRNAVPRVVGFGAMSRSLPQASAPPISGTYYAGDVVFNSAPAAGGNIGWVCTTDGTPGTWKTFGAIAA